MQLEPNTPLVASDVVANYTLQIVILGSLSDTITLMAAAPSGVQVSFAPSQILPGSESNKVVVSFAVSSSVAPGTFPLNITASSSGHTDSQKFSVEVVRYLVVTVGETFVPNSLSVPTGSTVYWMRLNGGLSQYDNGDHNVVFGTIQASSPTLAQYQSWSYTFSQAGAFGYQCTFHPGMTGAIMVT